MLPSDISPPSLDHRHGCGCARVPVTGVEPSGVAVPTPMEDWRRQVERWRAESPAKMSAETWDGHVRALDQMERMAGSGQEADAQGLDVLRAQYMARLQADMQRCVEGHLQQVLAIAAQYRALPGSTPSADLPRG